MEPTTPKALALDIIRLPQAMQALVLFLSNI
jgi:hypothetical protein